MDRLCPLLALSADGRSVVEGVDAGHACHALAEPMPLDRQTQAQLCLTPRHDRCERYLEHVAQRGGSPGRLPIADGLVSTRMMLAPEPAWRGIAGRARRGRSGRAAAVAGTVLVVGVAGAALARPALDGQFSVLDAAAAGSPSADPTPAVTLSTPSPTVPPLATPSPAAGPTASDGPTEAPTATASAAPSPRAAPTPTAVPAPTPAPAQTYVVEAGDTLAEIAERFGTSVAALQATNGIEDPNEIIIGQVLTIP